MRIHHLFSCLCILALLSSCNSGKESKANAFLHENNRHYCYSETSLVGTGRKTAFVPSVPEGALYLIKGVDFDNTWQRIFTLDGDEKRWY